MTIEQFNQTSFRPEMFIRVMNSGELKEIISVDFRRRIFIVENKDEILDVVPIEQAEIEEPEEITILPEIYIMNTVAEYFGMEVAEMIQLTRKRKYVVPKHISVFFCDKVISMGITEGEIYNGNLHGCMDRTTVKHAIKRVNDMEFTDEYIRSIKKKFSVVYADLDAKFKHLYKSSGIISTTPK